MNIMCFIMHIQSHKSSKKWRPCFSCWYFYAWFRPYIYFFFSTFNSQLKARTAPDGILFNYNEPKAIMLLSLSTLFTVELWIRQSIRQIRSADFFVYHVFLTIDDRGDSWTQRNLLSTDDTWRNFVKLYSHCVYSFGCHPHREKSSWISL